jgi:hypothetical protein
MQGVDATARGKPLALEPAGVQAAGVTFTCPHYEPTEEMCLLLGRDCVPGRPGCVLRNKSVFAVPVEERIREAEERRRERERRKPFPRKPS